MKYFFALICSLSAISLFAQHSVTPTDQFHITGAVEKEVKFQISDLIKFPQDALEDLILKNKRGEQKGVAKQLKGILLKTLLDSAKIVADKPKDYSELIIILTASDGYRNAYSWNELYNTDIGNHVYIITAMDGKTLPELADRILVVSLSDQNSGRRHLKALAKIEVKKVK